MNWHYKSIHSILQVKDGKYQLQVFEGNEIIKITAMKLNIDISNIFIE
jgi:hypothetical protein